MNGFFISTILVGFFIFQNPQFLYDYLVFAVSSTFLCKFPSSKVVQALHEIHTIVLPFSMNISLFAENCPLLLIPEMGEKSLDGW